MSVTDLEGDEDYKEYIKSEDLSVVHFYAPWAALCEHVDKTLENMCRMPQYDKVKFGKIVAEGVPEICLAAGITAVPTVLFIRNGDIIDKVIGGDPIALIDKIEELGRPSNATLAPTASKDSINSTLKELINQAPCMLFMKGNPSNPRCGFSRTIVSLLDSHNADYETFDILQNNAVREGLKKYSNWPTYPQLYVNGELIGGLDIVREMSDAGDLDTMLPKKLGPTTRS